MTQKASPVTQHYLQTTENPDSSFSSETYWILGSVFFIPSPHSLHGTSLRTSIWATLIHTPFNKYLLSAGSLCQEACHGLGAPWETKQLVDCSGLLLTGLPASAPAPTAYSQQAAEMIPLTSTAALAAALHRALHWLPGESSLPPRRSCVSSSL